MPELRRQLETSLRSTYTIERELGGGGMSRVFLADETRLGRKVVIKLLAPEFAEGLSAERFEREIRVAATLQEPHIVPVIATGVAAGLPYYTMPYIPGESLRARMSLSTIPLREAVSILRDIASALEYAHERGVVHRDIKPDNVLLSKRAAVVTDFGIAKAIAASRRAGASDVLTAVGTSLGTPPYMAPEQVAGDPNVDHRADLYSFGVLAYEIFTGSTPFAGRTPTQLIAAIMTEDPAPLSARRPDLPAALAALVMRLLAKDPLARPANAAEVLHALDAVATGEVQQEPRRAPRGLRPYLALTMAAALVLAGVGITYALRSRASDRSLKQQDDEFWVPGKAKSIAVLPLTNASGDTASAHFADGLTTELIGALSRVPGLHVIAQTSAFSLKGTGLSLNAIGDKLGVTAVLEGSVDRAGGRIRATINLVRPSDGTVLWSGNYNRVMADVFGVQEEIANAVVDTLHARTVGSAPTRLVGSPTRDLAAYELYLEGKAQSVMRGKDQLRAATTLFRQATERDPTFALAFSALADAYVASATFRFGVVSDLLARADSAADRAIALDPKLGDAHASKGFVLASRLSFDRAEESFRRAIALDPNSASAHHFYSLLLAMEGRTDDALRENGRALLLDPLAPNANVHRGVLYLLRGDRAEARRALNIALGLNQNFQIPLYFLGVVEAADGNLVKAAALLERALAAAPNFPGVRCALAFTYTQLGRKREADPLFSSIPTARQDDPARIDRALDEAVIGSVDRAFKTIPRVGWDIPSTINLRANPLLEPFRKDPRYATLLHDIGLKP